MVAVHDLSDDEMSAFLEESSVAGDHGVERFH